MTGFRYADIDKKLVSTRIELLFPGWKPGGERVCVLSPHDDDAILGAGYAILAAQTQGADVSICIFCRGNAGYSTPEEKDRIEQIRMEETENAYGSLGIGKDRIFRLEYSDFSACQSMGWQLNSGQEGSFKDIVTLLRREKITRVLVPNPYREHLDHWAAGMMGIFCAPQAGDPVLADWGEPHSIASVIQYSTWGDFSPEDALVSGRPAGIRGNRMILAPQEAEEKLRDGIMQYRSQEQIIQRLVSERSSRKNAAGICVEAYLSLDPRPRLEYSPYVRLSESL